MVARDISQKKTRSLRITHNWNEVVCNNRHIVPIDAESLDTFSSGINQSQSVSLSSGELELSNSSIIRTLGSIASCNALAIKIALSIDKVVV